MKRTDEYLNKSLRELGAWSWLREPPEMELNSDRLTIELDRISKKNYANILHQIYTSQSVKKRVYNLLCQWPSPY